MRFPDFRRMHCQLFYRREKGTLNHDHLRQFTCTIDNFGLEDYFGRGVTTGGFRGFLSGPATVALPPTIPTASVTK